MLSLNLSVGGVGTFLFATNVAHAATNLWESKFESETFGDWTYRDSEWTEPGSSGITGKAAKIDATANYKIIRKEGISTLGYDEIYITYFYQITEPLETGDSVILQHSTDNGITWATTTPTISGPLGTTTGWIEITTDTITGAEDISNLQVRLKAKLVKSPSSDKDIVFIDNFVLWGTEIESTPPPVPGCTDSEATNYDADATEDNGSCEYAPTDEEQCVLDGGTWNGDSCDMPPTDEEQCELDGGTWSDGSCDMPPTDEEQCVLDGGTWIEGSCDMPPTDAEQCEIDGGTWNGESCVMPPAPTPTPPPSGGGGSTTFVYWGCTDPLATNYNRLANTDDGSCVLPGNNGGGTNPSPAPSPAPAGEVLGEATTTPELPLPALCAGDLYLRDYLKMGMTNDPEQVKLIQTFLNEQGANLPVTGFFGPLTKAAVKKFQKEHHDEIIKPWIDAGHDPKSLKEGTGYVYKTTKRFVNMMKCKEADIPMPTLTL